jgi:predicted DNA-binding transcriptional regulator AlpA
MKGHSLSAPNSTLVTVLDICHLLGVCQRTVWLWVDLGRLPQPIRFSRAKVRWRRDDIERLIERGKTG